MASLLTPQRTGMVQNSSYSSEHTVVGADETGKMTAADLDRPKGAMPPTVPTLTIHSPTPYTGSRLDSPPATPSQALLDPGSQVQFATYREDPEKARIANGSSTSKAGVEKPWIPFPLRPWFWIPFVVLLVGIAIGLEVALHISNKRQGWATHGDVSNTAGILHYVYTLPPTAAAAVVAALWTWTDIEIKKMQPYVDLVHGDSPPNRSLLLDYTRHNNFWVWTRAINNKHYVVTLTSLMVLVTLAFQPLAAALLSVRPVWSALPDVTVKNLAAVGLNESPQVQDLTVFVSAAGFASASVLYNIPDAPFTHDQYTIAPFQLPDDVPINTTVVTVNTTAIKSDPGCRPVQVNMTQEAGGNWTNTASLNGCSFAWEVDHNATTLFGTNALKCDDPSIDNTTGPVIFWFFTYQPSVQSSATFCWPTISLWDVSASIDLASQNVTKVVELEPFTTSSNFSSLSGNITGPPLNRKAFNGIEFNLTNPDRFTLNRAASAQLQMPAAIFQSAVQSPQGVVASFTANTFVGLSTNVYSTYLKLIAASVYFLPQEADNNAHVMTTNQRVFVSSTAAHLLAVGFFILAFFALTVQLLHRSERRNLRLLHEPGTIASAVSIGGQTGMGELLAGKQDWHDIQEVLQNKKFRIDPVTNRIIMEGEDGYEWAASPKRKSVFEGLHEQWATHANNRFSKRFSKMPSPAESGAPGTPRTPKSPMHSTGA